MTTSTQPNQLNDLKKRLTDDITEGNEILDSLEPLLPPLPNENNAKASASEDLPKMPSTRIYAQSLRNVIQQENNLLEPLQKELPEALKAANLLLDEMETSRQAFKTAIAGLNYYYGTDAPEVLEFVSPPNALGYAREPQKRLLAHKRSAEAFQRRQADFDNASRLRKDLEHLLQQGQSLQQAHQSYLKESKESNSVADQALQALAEYRKQKSLLRQALMLELPNPTDAYNYIPKLQTKPNKTT